MTSLSIHLSLSICRADLGGSSGMAMRRSTASKGDAIINSLHALMDQLHRKVPGFHDSSFNHSNLTWHSNDKDPSASSTATPSIAAHVPTVLDTVFHDVQEPGPGGLSHEQTLELRALAQKTSARLKNLYCNAVGLHGIADSDRDMDVDLQRPRSPSMMRKTSMASRGEEFDDVDYLGTSGGSGGDVISRPAAVTQASPLAQNQWTTFHDQDGISVSEFSHSDYPMDTLMASCHVEVSLHHCQPLHTCTYHVAITTASCHEIVCAVISL
jgi:hypothetical protein